MNRKKIPALFKLSLALLLGVLPFGVYAALNPALPGLPSSTAAGYGGSTTLPNNAFSTMCVDCHTRNPVGGASANIGSHFVSGGPAAGADHTNSGGGWGTAGTNSRAGTVDNGAYFKINLWPGTTASKYGRISDNASISTSIVGNHTGTVLDNNNGATYQAAEIICESCHNIIVNGAGGNNILAPSVAQNSAASEDPAIAVIPNLCVGCHGDMYTASAANSAAAGTHQAKFESIRNWNETTGTTHSFAVTNRKNVNSIHFIKAAAYNMNHHVTTGDRIDNNVVSAGAAWRDTLTIDPLAYMTPVSNALGRANAQMPMGTWLDTKTAPPTAVGCLNCHVAGHGGNNYTAASILRDFGTARNAAGTGTISQTIVPTANPDTINSSGLQRLSDTGRSWFNFNDTAYCNDCHTRR